MIPLRYNGTTFTVPTSWREVTLGEFLHWHQRGEWPLPCNAEQLDQRSLYVLGTALSFLDELPRWDKLPYEPIDITEYAYGQKVDALHYYSQHAGDLHGAIPYILAIYRMGKSSYDHQRAIGKVESIKQGKLTENYPLALSIIRQLEAVEQELAANLKEVPYDPPEIKPCFEPLKKWGAYAVANSLVDNDFLRMDEVFAKSVAEVHTRIRFVNEQAWCQYRAGQVIKNKK